MIEDRLRALRAMKRPEHFEIFAPGLDHQTVVETACAWAVSKRSAQPDERSIAVLWNLLLAFPLDEDRVRRVPEEIHDLIREWRPTLEGRPGWSYETREVEE